jgi:hypothetical protein
VDTTDFTEQREELLHGIEQDEAEVRVAVHELSDAARSTLNVTEHIKKFPLTWVVGAFLIGAWLGRRGAPAHEPGQRRS